MWEKNKTISSVFFFFFFNKISFILLNTVCITAYNESHSVIGKKNVGLFNSSFIKPLWAAFVPDTRKRTRVITRVWSS